MFNLLSSLCCAITTKVRTIFINNVLDRYACLMQLKLALEIEYNICKSANEEKYFFKYKFVYDNI